MKTSFSLCWSNSLGEQIKRAASDSATYPLEFHPGSDDYNSFDNAVNQGIDSHLEAIRFTQGSGQHGRARFHVDCETLHVLVRRLLEDDSENSERLAVDICETLNIELV